MSSCNAGEELVVQAGSAGIGWGCVGFGVLGEFRPASMAVSARDQRNIDPAGILASSFSERLRLRSSSYRDMADRAYADGIVTAEEFLELEAERQELGLGEDLAAAILDSEQTRHSTQRRCSTCGQHIESESGDRLAPLQREAG